VITLFKYGPFGDVSDMSPFCRKVEVYFQLMRIAYTPKISGPQKSPTQKLPTINVDGTIISDSSTIISHFEAQHAQALDIGMSPEEKAIALAFQAMFEEKLYFITAWARWADDAGWVSYQPAFQIYFKNIGVPSLMIPLVLNIARKKVVKSIWTQGIGRHTPDEIYAMGEQILIAVSVYLGDKAFLMGPQVRTIDATAFAFLSGIIHVPIETPLKRAALALPNLLAYCDRMQTELDARK
jgi:glutathione S-transferase